ncbi:MAG TPA: energy transducer TonB [Thermoanaerobaculia bacterium]|nr:energy transducer TonB [Thermoanaerobaculia bacterium]
MRTRVRLAVALALLFALGRAAAAEGPLAIHAPPLQIPEETAGSGLAPEAAVKISIDARGDVTKVDVVSIVPASDYDEFFRKGLVGTISQWRFAPATEDGKPVASTLDWRVRFPAKPAQATGMVGISVPLPGSDAEQRRSTVLALPQEQRRKLLAAQTVNAMRFLDPKRKRDAASPRFAVHTDADDPKLAATVANNLETIYDVLAQELLPGISLQKEAYKIQVVVYRERASFQAMRQEMPSYEWSSGFYSAAGMIAFDLQQPSAEAVMSLLLHEATHAFLDHHVVRPGVPLPRWLGEGFADYVGNSRIQDGRLRPGKTLTRTFEMQIGRVRNVRTVAGGRLEEAKQALRQGKGLGVRTMLDTWPGIFYRGDTSLYYASSWLLVHYLRDGAPGWAQERFPRLVLYLAEGYPQIAAFRSVYGEPEAADDDFRKYVKAF